MVGAEKQFDPSLIVSIVHALLLPSVSIFPGFPHILQLIDVSVTIATSSRVVGSKAP